MENALREIDRLSDRLRSLRPLNSGEVNRTREEFIIENVFNSNAIEGSTLTLRETALILNEGVTIGGRSLREHLDAVGFKDAFTYIEELAHEKAEFTERAIKDIHSLVLVGDVENRGRYRQIQVLIGGSNYEPPDPHEIQEQLVQLLANYKRSNEHAVERIARLHLNFERIHPFIDGNVPSRHLLRTA